MSSPVIGVKNLGKRYRIRHQQQGGMRYKALRDVLADNTKGVAHRLWSAVRGSPRSAVRSPQTAEDFWALKNVSFEINQGDVVGIVGRNGAGKSTLLKVLSRITEPTEGRIRINGRVASLLEVGTGFHPELTGRENIFLNGAILGMARAEIVRKFDEIVGFAEVEKFLDTPVKRYSSGMYVRLAFAVAAHLEPEILVVDEVLAVGDAEFQKKCLGKMESVSRTEGRTVLFVSHNLAAILTLCSKAILLGSGRVIAVDRTKEICDLYTRTAHRSGERRISGKFLRGLELLDSNGRELRSIPEQQPLRFHCETLVPEDKCQVSLILKDAHSSPICELCDYSYFPPQLNGRPASIVAEANGLPLLPGHYSVDFWLGNRFGKGIEHIREAFDFEIVASQQSSNLFALQGPLKWPSRWYTTENLASTSKLT